MQPWERYPEECGLFFWSFRHAFVQELRSAALSALGHLKPEDKVALFAFSECAERLAFGAISTDTGPIMGPFAVSGPAITETEPNNNASQAQLLSGTSLVAGYIGGLQDIDYFKFTGRRGDIVTAICDTQGLNSYLDSVLYLTKSDGITVIAANDQNGLYYQSDSFLQAVLPEDGTYLIAVTDYYGYGGAGYPYRLHLRLTSGSGAPSGW